MKHIFLFLFLLLIKATYSQTPFFSFESSNYNEINAKFTPIGDKLYIEYSTYYTGPVYNEYFKTNQFIIGENANILYQNEVGNNDYPPYKAYLTKSVYHDSTIYSCGVLADYANKEFKIFIRKTDAEFNLIKDTIISDNYINITDMRIADSTILAVGPSLDTNVNIFKFNKNLELIDSSRFKFQGYFFFRYEFMKDDILKLCNFHTEECWLKIDSNLNIVDTIFSNLFNSIFLYSPSTFNLFLNDSIFISPANFFRCFGVPPNDSIVSQIGWNKWDIYGNFLDTVIPFKDTFVSDYFGLGKCLVKYSQDSVLMGFSRNMNDIDIRTDSSSIALIWSDLDGNVSKTVQFGGDYCYLVEDIHRFNNGNILVAARRKLWSPSAPHNTYDEVIFLLNHNGDIIQEINMSDKIRNQCMIFPNPATNFINLKTDNSATKIENIIFYDINSKEVKNINYPVNNKVNIESLKSGAYFIKAIDSERNVYSSKFIKK